MEHILMTRSKDVMLSNEEGWKNQNKGNSCWFLQQKYLKTLSHFSSLSYHLKWRAFGYICRSLHLGAKYKWWLLLLDNKYFFELHKWSHTPTAISTPSSKYIESMGTKSKFMGSFVCNGVNHHTTARSKLSLSCSVIFSLNLKEDLEFLGWTLCGS